MKNYKSLLWKLIIFVAVFIFVILAVRFFSGDEDVWLCQNGGWVKHGNPDLDKPIGLCGYEYKNIEIGGKNILVDIADTKEKRALGLSGKDNLKNNTGMLFLFEKEGSYGFWMKDMKFPIDIFWINDNLEVVGIEKKVSFQTYPEVFGQEFIASYVLELPAGFSDENNIVVGNKIFISEK